MAGERLTKEQRRAQARAERKAAELAAAKRARQRRIITIVVTVLVIAGIVAVFVLTRTPPVDEDIAVDPADFEAAIADAGCEPIQVQPATGGNHLSEPAPSPQQLYDVLPTAGGPHLDRTSAVGAFNNPLNEVQTTHNLEHGAVIAWYVPDDAQGGDADTAKDWARARNSAGFRSQQTGAGVIVAPYPDGTSSGKPFAFRAWNVAVDCDRFNQTFADGFLITNFGTHGQAPEASLGPYPEGVLYFTTGPTPGPSGSASPTAGRGGRGGRDEPSESETGRRGGRGGRGGRGDPTPSETERS